MDYELGYGRSYLDSSNYNQWLLEVDRCLLDLCEMDSRDLQDYDYREAFEDQTDPEDVANFVLEEAGW